MKEEKTEKNLEDLNSEQKEAVKFGQGPLLIVAGAGTGKTTVITRRIIHLIQSQKAKPEEILALTFTDKAAEEMEDRVIKLLPIGYIELWISTFHSFCQRILKEHGLDIGLSTDFKLLDQTQSWLLVRQNLDKFNLDYYKPLGNPTKFIHALISHFSRCKDEGIYPEEYLTYSDSLRLNLDGIAIGSRKIKSKDKKELAMVQQEADRIKEVAEAYFTYQKLLLDNNALDFGDLINYCLKLFKERAKILEKYRNQFKYILVDEFQDTNWVQYELVRLLAFPKNNLTVSADDDQAIYRFRGASFNNVLQFRKDYPQAKEVILIKNYRSTQNILDLSYKFIQLNNPNRLEYQLNQAKEISKIAKEKGVNLNNFKKINKQLIATKEKQGIIESLHFETLEQETRGVVEKISKILNDDKTATFNDFAILVRANNQAPAFCRELERAGLPYQFLASKGLYSKPVILDIISYLKLLDNYHESSALFRILNCPCFKIPYEDITRITQYSHLKGQSIYESLQQLPLISNLALESINKINFLLDLIKKHTNIAKEKNVSEVFIAFLRDSGYLSYIIKKEYAAELDLINQFYDRIKTFEENQIAPSLTNFIEQLNLELEAGEEGSLKLFDIKEGPDMIKVMTLHSAKGLEFKYVFLVNLVDKRFPSIERKEPIEIPEKLVKEIIPQGDIHLQEERRLFYVGMTRAKKGLFFTWADNYGGLKKKRPSRFLIECGLTKEKEEKPTHEPSQSTFQSIDNSISIVSRTQKLPIPSHFSYTQFAAFQKCPLQYKFAHILKVPRPGKPALSFGKAIHQTLYEFVKQFQENILKLQGNLFSEVKPNLKEKKIQNLLVQNIGLEDLLEIYKKNWIDEWYSDKIQKEKYYKLGEKCLKIFYQDFAENIPKIQYIEGKPALEQNFNLKIENYSIIGKIDRINVLSEHEVEIMDYKTGRPKEKLSSEDKQQLLIYQIAAEEVLGLNPIKLTYYYLEEGKKVSFLGKEQDKKSFKEEILEIIEKIKSNDFFPAPGRHCQYCDFKDICEFREEFNN